MKTGLFPINVDTKKITPPLRRPRLHTLFLHIKPNSGYEPGHFSSSARHIICYKIFEPLISELKYHSA